MHLTQKQLETIIVLTKGNKDGTPVDLDQLLERLSYKPSKQSIQFTIRALIKHELIEKCGSEKRRARVRTLLVPTPLGQHYANGSSGPSIAKAILEPEFDGDLG